MQSRREAAIHQLQEQAEVVSQIHRELDHGELALAQRIKDAHSLGLSIDQIASAVGLDNDGVIELIAKRVLTHPLLRAGSPGRHDTGRS